MARSAFLTKVANSIKKVGRFLLGLLVLAVVLAVGQYCDQISPFKEPTPTARPAPTATPEASISGSIVALLEQGVIEVEAQGAGIDELELAIRRLLDELIEVEIPVGTYFLAGSGSTQNMVVRQEVTIVISWDGWQDLVVDVACGNMHRGVPDSSDSFDIVMAPEQAELQALVATIDARSSSWGWEYGTFDVVQAAIWIVTDDAGYGGLGTLVRQSGIGGLSTRVILEDEAARAMRMVDEAGIDITQRQIWQDRDLIAAGAEDATLVEWIREREQGGG